VMAVVHFVAGASAAIRPIAAPVLGTRSASTADALTQFDRVLDRSRLMPAGAVESGMKGMNAGNDLEQ
jgi:hypothetical protein